MALLLCVGSAFAQETTGGLQGTIKDPTGAVVPHAKVSVTGSSMVGSKEAETDDVGYYRFANLPPGNYTITVTATGFSTEKHQLVLEVGHLPSIDFSLKVGKTEELIEVTAAIPQIDLTTNTSTQNITEDVIAQVPHGRSFQSVIQFAPSARNEPLMGNSSMSNGTGGGVPGSTSNGGDHGFSVAGGADSENSYLVEGQETANLIGGYSHTNVPFDFVQEMEIKNSGIQAEYGGALGGVVNVIMKKGKSAGNEYHGSVFAQFENQAMDARGSTFVQYDPNATQTTTSWGAIDPTFQEYVPKKDKTSDVMPGFTFGGPIWKDRIYGIVGFNPEFNDQERTVDYTSLNNGVGLVAFSRNTQTYYTYGRIDAEVTKKIRVYGSWLYQLQKQYGTNLPFPDSTNGPINTSLTTPTSAYPHGVGYTAPNSTTNVGADFTITPQLIATARFGYYFENYHDFGLPTSGTLTIWNTDGVGATDALGNPLPPSLQQTGGYSNIAYSPSFTKRDASKGIQVDGDLAWFKSGWAGTHNFKFGYQLSRLSNYIVQNYSVPDVNYNVGFGSAASYNSVGPTGAANCAPFIALYGYCQGQYGYITITDAGTVGAATSYNHSLFAQDAWTVGRGITINVGLRVEKEWLPAENQPSGGISHPINFGWGDKIAPRLGMTWDPFRNGKMKVFGGYGQFYDEMKLNLAISSFGGAYWNNCYYALSTSNVASIAPVFDSTGRYCPGVGNDPTAQANFGGATPSGITFLENQNYRTNPTTCSTCTLTEEGVAPGLKPYKQHEYTLGVDYQVTPTLAFEARYDRRRLDHVIEDSALYNASASSETFVIVNPGQGVNATYNSFYNFLYGLTGSNQINCSPTTTPACPNIIPAQRDYDGLEFRLTKAPTKHWSGMVSYTYSRLWGNYSGLTSSDQSDGGGGRNSPNNSRSFDEPYFSWSANGTSSSGLLPTDRPHTFKGYAYYELGWLKSLTTDFGIFQIAYSGSPETSYMDVGQSAGGYVPITYGGGAYPVDVVGRGQWVDVTQNPATGLITASSPYTKRTPWYVQTDFDITQNYKISEGKTLSFTATVTNVLNQRSVTSVGENIDSYYANYYITPGGYTLAAGTPFYAAAMAPYNYVALMNASSSGGPLTVSSAYGQPNRFQAGRTIRLGLRFQF